MKRILLIENEAAFARQVVLCLLAERHHPVWAKTLEEAAELLREPESEFDLILLELGFPQQSSVEFCRRLRAQGDFRPILLLVNMEDDESVLQAVRAGGNDYLRRPFRRKELFTRIRLLHGAAAGRFADLEVDFGRGVLRHVDGEIALSRTKLEILHCLISSSGQIVTRDGILNHLRKNARVVNRTVDGHISQLRRELRRHESLNFEIASIYGSGYRIERSVRTESV